VPPSFRNAARWTQVADRMSTNGDPNWKRWRNNLRSNDDMNAPKRFNKKGKHSSGISDWFRSGCETLGIVFPSAPVSIYVLHPISQA